MFINIFLWASIIWVAPLACYLLINEAKFKKNIVIGVTLPYQAREDEKVQEILKRFKKQQILVCIILLVLAIPCLFAKGLGLSMALWCSWIDLLVILPNVVYVMNNKALKKVKAENGWKRENTDSIRIDTVTIPPDKWLSPWVFFPAFFLSLLPVIWDKNFWTLYAILAAIPVTFWLIYRYLYRNKSETIDENTGLARVLTQVRRRNWRRMWLVCAYCFSALSLVIFLTQSNPMLGIILTIAIVFFITLAIIRVEMNTRKIQEKLTAQSGRDWYVDDDDKWIGGIIYYNPNDSRFIINNRIGTNSSFNLAKPAGKAIMGFVVLLLIAMPFTGILLDSIAGKEIELELTKTGIVSTNGSARYSILYEEIAEVELLEKLPMKMTRKFGIGMENLLRGSFSAEGIGNMEVCLDPRYPPFILITTRNDKHYLFGTRHTDLTKQIFEQLSASLNSEQEF